MLLPARIVAGNVDAGNVNAGKEDVATGDVWRSLMRDAGEGCGKRCWYCFLLVLWFMVYGMGIVFLMERDG